MAAVPLPGPATSDVTAVFEHIRAEIAIQVEKLERLRQTVDILMQSPELFNARDVEVMSTVLRKQVDQVAMLQQGLEMHRELYEGAVKHVEERIFSKTKLLHDVDERLGAISGNPTLCAYFAQEQAELMAMLDATKQKLVQTACSRLGPLLYPALSAPPGASATRR